jgi:cullin 1
LTTKVLPELESLAQEYEASGQNSEAFLEALQRKWENHGVMVRWMQRFFQYLDRFYVEINSLTPLSEQGFKLFKGFVFQPLVSRITSAVLHAITRERHEELVDVDLLKKTVDIYVYLSSDKLVQESGLNPKKHLEDKVIEQARQYYHLQS